jgi:hypothetical protein
LFYQLTAANDDPHEHAHGDEDMDNASQASSSWTDSHSAPPGSPRRRHHYDLDPFQDDEHLHGAHSQASFAQSDPFLAPLDITAPLRQVNHSLEGTPGASALVTSTVELRMVTVVAVAIVAVIAVVLVWVVVLGLHAERRGGPPQRPR